MTTRFAVFFHVWLLCVCCALCASAQAQTSTLARERWLVLPVRVSDGTPSADSAKLTVPFEDALRAAGQDVVTSVGASALFETNQSAEPVQLDDDEMTRLLRRVGEAARHLALGELVLAQQAMEGVYALSGPARDFLNREAARARKIFDNCLVASYLWERGNEHQRALRQMLDCSRSFPGFRPEGRAYPPEMRELFDQATLRLGQMQSTTLLVRSGERNGCGVRLNGIEVGKSPMSFSDVRSGMTRVQLECEPGVPGRIHEIELQPGDNHLLIDPDFDRVLRTRGVLWLEYVADEERRARADTDARTVARLLNIDRIVELRVSSVAGSANLNVSVRPLGVSASREVAQLAFNADAGYDVALVSATVADVLRQAEAPLMASDASVAGTSLPAAGRAESTSDLRDERPSGREPLLGIPLAVAGGGGLIAGWVLYQGRQDVRRPLYASGLTLAQRDTFANRGTLSLLVTSLGATAFTLSDYFWLPNTTSAPRVPVWAWGVGAAGAAVGLTGVGFAVFGDHCDIADPRVLCQTFTADSDFGPTLLMNGLPLLGVPLTYLVREALAGTGGPRAELRTRVSADRRGGALSLEGTF
jgi:hypothetical protein